MPTWGFTSTRSMKSTTKSCSTYLSAKRLHRGHCISRTSAPAAPLRLASPPKRLALLLREVALAVAGPAVLASGVTGVETEKLPVGDVVADGAAEEAGGLEVLCETWKSCGTGQRHSMQMGMPQSEGCSGSSWGFVVGNRAHEKRDQTFCNF